MSRCSREILGTGYCCLGPNHRVRGPKTADVYIHRRSPSKLHSKCAPVLCITNNSRQIIDWPESTPIAKLPALSYKTDGFRCVCPHPRSISSRVTYTSFIYLHYLVLVPFREHTSLSKSNLVSNVYKFQPSKIISTESKHERPTRNDVLCRPKPATFSPLAACTSFTAPQPFLYHDT